jgi:DNA-binding IclR family transcriptional regulator
MSDALGTVARTLSILRIIAEAKTSVGVKDVADALQLPMSTSHRLLDLLLGEGFVQKDVARRRYAIGSELSRLANLVSAKISFSSLVQPLLDELTRETGETALFATYLPAQHAMTYTAKSDSPQPLRYRINLHEHLPLEWGATGLAILAFLPEEIQTEVFAASQPSPASGRRLTRKAFYERLQIVKQDGFAVTESEKLPDSIGIAAPIETAPGHVIGSIGFTIPKVRFSRNKQKLFSELVRSASARIARRTSAT